MPFPIDYIGRVHEFGCTKWYPTGNWSRSVEKTGPDKLSMIVQMIDSVSIPIDYVFYFHGFLVFILLTIVLSDMFRGNDYE